MMTSEFSLSRAIRLLLITLEIVIVVALVVRAAQYPLLTPSRMRMQGVLTNLLFVSLALLVLLQIGCLFSPMRRLVLFSLVRLFVYALVLIGIAAVTEENESQAGWRRTQSANGSLQSPRGFPDGKSSVERSHADRAQGFY
jgi:hypothetical protein